MENTLPTLADKLVGLDEGAQISQIRKQFLVDKFLSHTAEVIKMSYKFPTLWMQMQSFPVQRLQTHKSLTRATQMKL